MDSSSKIKESVLDAPKPIMDPTVWTISEEGEVRLVPEAETKIQKVVDWAQSKYSFPQLSVFIIGSITSNSYTENSDIDIDFCCPYDGTKEDIKEFGWKFKKDFIDNFADSDSDDYMIGSHPFEVFFQPNPFQCMMSVGCYNFTQKKWEVGPELKKPGFDPISEYYPKGMKLVKTIIDDIRSIILDVYEQAFIMKKTGDERFLKQQEKELYKKISEAGKIYRKMKRARSAYKQDPQSREEALKMRADKKWHVTDASYKFLDKFGYVSILKQFCVYDDAEEEGNPLPLQQVLDEILETIRKNIADNRQLNDSEKKYFCEIEAEDNQVRIWIDDVRQPPEGYLWFKKTEDFIDYVDQNGVDDIKLIDIDHDAGDFQEFGGDYIRCLDYLEFRKAKNLNIRIHSQNPVGVKSMRQIIKKNGWNEVLDITEDDEQAYEPPYTLAQIQQNYPEEVYAELSSCPIHKWRAENGIELVHREPTSDELERIWKNWQLMSSEQKEISDKKSLELFGMDNAAHYDRLTRDDYPGFYVGQRIKVREHLRCMESGDECVILKIEKNPTYDYNNLTVKFDDGHCISMNDGSFEKLPPQQLEEGLKEVIQASTLAALLAFPSVLPAKILEKNITALTKKGQVVQVAQKYNFDQAILDSLSENTTYGGYRVDRAMCVLALTLFGEGRDQPDEGMKLILDSIINRAAENLNDVPGVCLAVAEGKKAHQYSYWNKHTQAKELLKKQIVVPQEALKNPIEAKAWEKCKGLAAKVFTGQYVVGNKNINSYYVTNMDDPPTWAKLLTNKVIKGSHTFGYLKSNDSKYVDMVTLKPRNIKKAPTIAANYYTVQAGDTLGKIAKQYNTSVQKIAKDNLLSNPDEIRIGQKLRV